MGISTFDRSRILWVDTAKSIGIAIVFLGHLLYGGSEAAGFVNRAIYSFHMPMFFILSGYVLRPDSKAFGEYVKGKLERVLLPAIIIYIATLPLYFYALDTSSESVATIIRTVFYIDGRCAYNAPIWFFFCLFEVYILVKIFKLVEACNIKLLIVAVISLLCSFVYYMWDLPIFNIFGFNKCLLGLFFVCFGIVLRRSRFDEFIQKIGVVSIPIWLIAGVWLNEKVSMYGVDYGNYWLFIISAITGSFVFFAFSKMIEKNNFIRQFSKWTIFIVCSHYVLITFFHQITSAITIEGTFIYDVLSVLFVVVSLIIYRPVCVLVERYIPILTGNKKYGKDNKRN